jgi:hypothetical protein
VPDGVFQWGEDSLIFFVEIETEGDKRNDNQQQETDNHHQPAVVFHQETCS